MINKINENINLFNKYKYILNFFNKNNINNININNFYNLIHNNEYCNIKLGSGMMGNVIESKVGSKMTIYNGKKNIRVPVVIKKAYLDESSDFDIVEIDKHYYISAYKNINCECIIFIYLLKLWYEKLSPHLPLFIGYSTCDNNNITNIITERQGLDKEIYLHLLTFQILIFL